MGEFINITGKRHRIPGTNSISNVIIMNSCCLEHKLNTFQVLVYNNSPLSIYFLIGDGYAAILLKIEINSINYSL